MLYRDLQYAAHRMDRIDAPLCQDILGNSAEEMANRVAQVEAAATQLICRRQEVLRQNAGTLEVQTSDGRAERAFVQAAVKALQVAVTQAQKVVPDADISALRARLLDVKAQADIAKIYLHVAVGQTPT